jgi:hypothetical protein
MNDRTILSVEDNLDDEALTLRPLKKNNISNEVDIARDGMEALDDLHGNGNVLPALVLLDLKLPKVDGLGSLASHASQIADTFAAGCHSRHLEGRAGPHQQLSSRREQQCPQAGQFRTVFRGGPPTGRVLAPAE